MSSIQSDVCHMFAESFVTVTEQVAGFPLSCVDSKENVKATQNVKIQTKGVFCASLYFSMEQDFADAILKRMSNGKPLSPDMRDLYIGEYVNILVGHGLTKINNLVGQTSRLTIPKVGLFAWEDKGKYKMQHNLLFKSACGNMKVEIGYDS